MATENPRVWFKSISLENVRSFGEKQTINFTDKDGNAARWNVILGDNGTGKTTVLRGLFLSLNASAITIENGQNGNAYYLRKPEEKARVNTTHQRNDNALWEQYITIQWLKGIFHKTIAYDGGQALQTIDVLSTISIHAYGASRNINEISTEETGTKAVTLLNENATLIGPASWLMEAEYIDFKTNYSLSRYDLVKSILLKLFAGEISDIEIRVDSSPTPKVFFKTHYGDVRLHELSLGYKTLIAWMVDFAKDLLDRYPDSSDPLAEPAVCLVDEIDLHLHPKFQRTIIKFLTETFPDTQFIVTAHSPLIVIAAEERPLDANIILLKREGDQTVVVNDPVDVTNWSVDQVLNSDLFGEVGVRPPEAETKMQRRRVLLLKDERTHNENQELEQLEQELGVMTASESKEALKAFQLIGKLLSR